LGEVAAGFWVDFDPFADKRIDICVSGDDLTLHLDFSRRQESGARRICDLQYRELFDLFNRRCIGLISIPATAHYQRN
tara:strand:- start:159 stop:392 length:234 start_codon:yes stop_codon:yes gene_type:complete